jgi:multiple sugar transport system permease protein
MNLEMLHLKKKRKKFLIIFLFLLPSMFGFVFFQLVPITTSLYLSLTDWDVISGDPDYVGFENYASIFSGEEFWRVLKNTLYYIVLYIPLIILVSVGVASLLNHNYKGMSFFKAFFYIPVLTSWVAGALVWKWLLSPQFGPINQIIGFFGINGPAWLYDATWAIPGIVFASIWKDAGFFGLICLAGLKGINPVYYEAAEIDGATKFKKFMKITLPLISPTLFFIMIMSIINSFQLFPQVMIMTEGGPHGSTQVIVERIYNYAFSYYKMGYAAAYSWVLFIFIFVVTIIQFALQKRWVTYDT